MLDNLFTFVCVLSPDGTLISANEAPLKAAGINADEVIGSPLWNCYWWSWSPIVQEEVKAAIGLCVRANESATTRTSGWPADR